MLRRAIVRRWIASAFLCFAILIFADIGPVIVKVLFSGETALSWDWLRQYIISEMYVMNKIFGALLLATFQMVLYLRKINDKHAR